MNPADPSSGTFHAYDIIGDTHGCRGTLEEVLHTLGYSHLKSGSWKPPINKNAIYVGDCLDRGPDVPGVVDMVRRQVYEGTAVFVLGNHEYNLIKLHTIMTWNKTLSRSDSKTFGMTEAQLKDAKKSYEQYKDAYGERRKGELDDVVNFFKSCPLTMTNNFVRVSHAGYNSRNAALLNDIRHIRKDAPLLVSILEEKHGTLDAHNPHHHDLLNTVQQETKIDMHAVLRLEEEYGLTVRQAMMETLKGRIYDMNRLDLFAPELHGVDKDALSSRGKKRPDMRVIPWAVPADAVMNLSDILFLPKDYLAEEIAGLPQPQKFIQSVTADVMRPAVPDPRPEFFGHYYINAKPYLVDGQAACLDFKSHITAYRHGITDSRLQHSQLVAIPT